MSPRSIPLLLAACLTCATLVAGCGGASAETSTTRPAPTAGDALPGLPAFTAGFGGWVRLNADPIPPSTAAPHGQFKNVHVNRDRSALAGVGGPGGTPYPNGTVIVKSGSEGDDPLGVVAVMRKRDGVDPVNGDWNYREFTRPSPRDPYTAQGGGANCRICHAVARDTDFVFTALE
jgi:hypothetical protein